MAVVSVEKLSEAGKCHRLDAEFYQPQYFIDFSKGNWEPIKRFLDICQYGISQAMIEEPKGYPIFRMDDIKNCFLLDDEVKYLEIPQQIFEQFKLENNDILFNRVNAEEFVGRTGIFKLKGDYVFASYLIRLRVRPNTKILPDYLNIFLNTKYGKKQIRKFSRRAVNQVNVNAEELKNFKICIIPLEIQKQISQLSDEVWHKIELSNSFYTQAENLLLEELGLKDFKPKYEKTYSVNLSKAFGVHRIDAEYFQPAYQKIMKKMLEKYPTFLLKRIFDFRRGVFISTKYYTEEITDRPYIRIKELSGKIDIDESKIIFINDDYPENKIDELKENDLVIAIIGDTIGKTNKIPRNLVGGFCSNNVGRLRIRDEWINKILPEFAEILFQSVAIQSQIEQKKAPTGQPKITDSEIKSIKIPILSVEIQQKIASLVQQSHEARKKAKELLEEAKRKVEEAIENEIKK